MHLPLVFEGKIPKKMISNMIKKNALKNALKVSSPLK